ncbi:MAG: hypothetical protein NVS3B21_28400 [Acidimicrobiales bacterium]
MGRVLRVKVTDIDELLERSRVAPGSLKHLYPDPKSPAVALETDD